MSGESDPQMNADERRLPKGNVKAVGDLTICDDPNMPVIPSDLWAVPRALLVQFPDDETCRAAMRAGRCEFTVFEGEEGEG